MSQEEMNSLEDIDRILAEEGLDPDPKEPVEVVEEEKEVDPSIGVVEPVEPVAEVPVAPEFDFSYKVREEILEIPEKYRSLVTDEESLKEIKALFSKATGIEHVQTERKQYRDELNTLKPKFEDYDKLYSHVNKLHAEKDFEQLISLMNIPDEAILQLAWKKIQYDELPSDQKMIYDNERKYRDQAHNLGLKVQKYENTLSQIEQREFQANINEAFSKPEIQSFVRTFEQQNGEGSFIEELKTRGIAHYQMTGQDKHPAELLNEMYQKYGAFIQPKAEPEVVQPEAVVTTPKAPTSKPVIPSLGGSNVSPVKKPITSLEALDKELEAALG